MIATHGSGGLAARGPRVSLVVPVFNEEPAVIRASLDSVRAQSFGDFECVVVDESTKESSAVACRDYCAQDPRFAYLHPSTRVGLAASLNLGVESARGDYIARFDSDDLCAPDRLKRQVAFLDANPPVSVVGAALEIMNGAQETVAFRHYPLTHADIARGIHLTNTIAHPTVMCRRSTFCSLGGYDAAFKFSEDLDLWLRWMNAGVVFANLPDVLVRYRQDQTRRNPGNWHYNLHARVRNFRRTHAVRRLIGICLIGLWSVIPGQIQEAAFRVLIFRRRRREATT